MSNYPKSVRPQDVVNSIFGDDLFMIEGGRATYDEVYMSDGGSAVCLVRVRPAGFRENGAPILSVTRRYITWDTPLIQLYDPRHA